jgi:hypothetical protein
MLHRGLTGGVKSGDSYASEDALNPTTLEQVVQRFEHYELLTGKDGNPVELGRGAMGVTYKAFSHPVSTSAQQAGQVVGAR